MADQEDEMSSDLSELDTSDSEGDIPLEKKPRGPPKKTAAATLVGALRPPRTVQYTAQTLFEQMERKEIELCPPYQRGEVWAPKKQSTLVGSIYLNYYIPPVIFSVKHNADGTDHKTTIDGKQRLTSIRKFMDGEIDYKDPVNNKKLVFKGKGGTLLTEAHRNLFKNKQIVCVEYDGLTDKQEREIFQRVQLGVPLTPAERMGAIASSKATFTGTIQTMVAEEGFAKSIGWNDARGKDFFCVASMIYMSDRLASKEKFVHPGAPQVERWLQLDIPLSEMFKFEITDTFRVFIELAKDKKLNTVFVKPRNTAPAEFTLIAYLIYKFRLKISLKQLATAIRELRADVRTAHGHSNIKTNSKIIGHMSKFIEKYQCTSDADVAGRMQNPAKTPRPSAADPSTKSKPSKRKRTDSENESEEEENPSVRVTKTFKATRGGARKDFVESSSMEESESEEEVKPAPKKKASTRKSVPVPKIEKPASAAGMRTRPSSLQFLSAPPLSTLWSGIQKGKTASASVLVPVVKTERQSPISVHPPQPTPSMPMVPGMTEPLGHVKQEDGARFAPLRGTDYSSAMPAAGTPIVIPSNSMHSQPPPIRTNIPSRSSVPLVTQVHPPDSAFSHRNSYGHPPPMSAGPFMIPLSHLSTSASVGNNVNPFSTPPMPMAQPASAPPSFHEPAYTRVARGPLPAQSDALNYAVPAPFYGAGFRGAGARYNSNPNAVPPPPSAPRAFATEETGIPGLSPPPPPQGRPPVSTGATSSSSYGVAGPSRSSRGFSTDDRYSQRARRSRSRSRSRSRDRERERDRYRDSSLERRSSRSYGDERERDYQATSPKEYRKSYGGGGQYATRGGRGRGRGSWKPR